jgi:predicted nuclease with RNAse H fold
LFQLQSKSIVGIDLATKPSNPTGWACLERKVVETCLIYEDTDILRNAARIKPVLIAIDAPLSPPKGGAIRSADRRMIKMGYPIFPPMMHG